MWGKCFLSTSTFMALNNFLQNQGLRYPYQRFSPAWNSISGAHHGLFLLCQFVNHIEVIRLPIYYPSQQEKDEERGSPQGKISKDSQTTRTEGNLYMPETFELADTGTPLAFKMDSSFLGKVSAIDSSRAHSFQQRSIYNEEIDGHVSCHLNLTLASSPLQVDKVCYPSSMPQSWPLPTCFSTNLDVSKVFLLSWF